MKPQSFTSFINYKDGISRSLLNVIVIAIIYIFFIFIFFSILWLLYYCNIWYFILNPLITFIIKSIFFFSELFLSSYLLFMKIICWPIIQIIKLVI